MDHEAHEELEGGEAEDKEQGSRCEVWGPRGRQRRIV
jgi:hypothetical protein